MIFSCYNYVFINNNHKNIFQGKKIEYEDAKPMAESVKKDLHHGPFDVLRMIFSSDRSKPSPDVIGKQELFFQDYSLMPKFVFENYTSIRPFNNTDNRVS